MSLIAMGAWGEGIEHREQDKAHNEDAEQFQIVITYKTPTIHVLKILFLILHDQSETTEKEENWLIGLIENRPQLIVLPLAPRIFVLTGDALQPMAVVMKHNAKNGNALHCCTFSPCQYLFHFFFNVL